MWRSVLLGVVLLAACNDQSTSHRIDAPVPDAATADAAPPDAAFVPRPDAPPPSMDAGPPPVQACGGDAGACEVPPSTCLDENYLIYYTGGTCEEGTCQFTTNLMYCDEPCVYGGCFGGFT